MLSKCAFNESVSRQFQQEKCHCLWVTEPCVNMILMHCRGMGKKIITRWNKFISGNAERNKSTSQMSNKILKEDGVSKAAWLLQLHQGTLSAVDINVFQTPRQFLRAQLSLAATQPPIILQRQTHSKVEPKAELKQSTNMKENPYGKGTRWREEKKKEIKCGVREVKDSPWWS